VWKLSQVLNEYRPDLVHVRMFKTQLSPFILPLLKDIPSLYHVGSYQSICPINTKILPDGSTCRHLAGIECYRAGCVSIPGLLRIGVQHGAWRRWRGVFRLIVANSKWLGQRLRGDGIDVREIIPNGTPIRAPRPALQELPIVAYAGRLVPEKGVDVLLESMDQVVKKIPASHLLIAGDGPNRRDVETQIDRLGLRPHVTMLGHLDPEPLAQRMSAAWVQIVPSRYEDPFPNIIIESMMRGVAVIAAATGGAIEIVRDGLTGYLVPPGDPSILTERMIHLLENRAVSEQMGAAGRAVALAEFTEDRMVDRFLEVYRKLAPGGEARQ
jgi:glycosyltransferase involved in cell wall biosynthesis